MANLVIFALNETFLIPQQNVDRICSMIFGLYFFQEVPKNPVQTLREMYVNTVAVRNCMTFQHLWFHTKYRGRYVVPEPNSLEWIGKSI